MKRRARTGTGQALVEFSLAIIVFLVLMMAVVDLGRAIYTYNALSEAARDIARQTSVHPGSPLGTSAETTAAINTQRKMVPQLGTPSFSCVDIDGSSVTTACLSGNRVSVGVSAPYRPLTPLLGLTGTWTLQSSSSIQIP